MKLEVTPDARRVEITLSRRNILALLHKLDLEGSHRTLAKESGEWLLIVKVEDDSEHYAEGVRPGQMLGATEKFIQDHLKEL